MLFRGQVPPMGFSLTDLGDEKNVVFVNFWNWRPTVELIRSFSLIDDERLETMGIQCVSTKITEQEARLSGQTLRDEVLPKLRTGEPLRLDLSVTAEPDDGKMHYGVEAYRNYSATVDWLQHFSSFCLACRGFEVL